MKFASRFIVAVVFSLALPLFVFASPIINIGGQSMCKPIAEIVKNEASFSGQSSVTMSESDMIDGNGTIGYVTVQAIASNTGDSSQSVSYAITNNSGSAYSTSHSFNTTVNGVPKTVTLNSTFPTKIEHLSSYKIVRYAKDNLDDTQSISKTTNYSVNLPATGLTFNDYFSCNGYGLFTYPISPVNATPQNWQYEQGFQNVYKVTKQSSAPNNNNCEVNFNANPNSLTAGSTTYLNWTSNTGSSGCAPAVSCIAENGWASGTLSANSSSYPYVTSSGQSGSQTLTLKCTFPNGEMKSSSTVLNFNSNQQSNCTPTLDASPNTIYSGSLVNLYWNATGNSCTPANYCFSDDSYSWGGGQLANSGNRTYQSPTSLQSGTLNFRVKCYYPNSQTLTATDSVTVQGQSQNYGNPTIDASPYQVIPGSDISIIWSGGYGATNCYATNGWANSTIPVSGSLLYKTNPGAQPGSSQNFQIRCSYQDGSQRDASDTIVYYGNVPPPLPVPVPVPVPTPNLYQNPGNSGTSGIAGSPIVRTMDARSIEKSSAKIRGYFNANGCPVISTWFEYGPERGVLEYRSSSLEQANKYGNVEFVATNLKSNTKYYYRIVGQNCKGISYGSVESFRTAKGSLYSAGGTVGPSTTVKNNTTVVKNTTTVVDNSIQTTGAGTSYLRLDVTNDNDIPNDYEPIHTVIRGEIVVYRVVWENLTKSLLHDGKIRVNLPSILTYMNSSNGIYDKSSHSLYMTIGDIAGRASGVEFITVQVGTNGQLGDPVIVEATAAFDAPGSDAQINATDYDEDILGDREIATAVTPFFGNWMWFIVILLLLILVFLIARYHTLASQYRNNGYRQPYTPPMPVHREQYAERPAPRPEHAELPTEGGENMYKPYNPNE